MKVEYPLRQEGYYSLNGFCELQYHLAYDITRQGIFVLINILKPFR